MLRENTTLEELYLNVNDGIGDEGAKFIGSALENCSLKNLWLRDIDIGIGDEGLKAIAAGMYNNKSLTILYLCDNDISDEGCKFIAKMICGNATLCTLELGHSNRITDSDAALLEHVLEHVNYAVEEINFSDYDEGFSNISQIQRDRITNLCNEDSGLKEAFQHNVEDLPRFTLGLWPQVLESIGTSRIIYSNYYEVNLRCAGSLTTCVDGEDPRNGLHTIS